MVRGVLGLVRFRGRIFKKVIYRKVLVVIFFNIVWVKFRFVLEFFWVIVSFRVRFRGDMRFNDSMENMVYRDLVFIRISRSFILNIISFL